MTYFFLFLGVLASYLIGSIPTAYIACRLLKGTDIRKVGSGNVGATNAMRVLGKGWGTAILFFDVLKGFVPVIVLGNILAPHAPVIPDELLRILIGLCCISGHNWTIFLGFKGGKGVATTLGVLIGLAIMISGLRVVLLSTVITWFVVFLLARIVSAASIISAVTFPVYLMVFKQSNILISTGIIFSIFIILRHKSNIQRLIRNQEKKLF